jgi:hypothetical protein
MSRAIPQEFANRVANDKEYQEWISGAALLVVLQTHRAHGADSQDDSMAGLRLPQAGHIQDVSLGSAKHHEGVADGT